jgi:hypothetical protein
MLTLTACPCAVNEQNEEHPHAIDKMERFLADESDKARNGFEKS